jgi:hypothetical protein
MRERKDENERQRCLLAIDSEEESVVDDERIGAHGRVVLEHGENIGGTEPQHLIVFAFAAGPTRRDTRDV